MHLTVSRALILRASRLNTAAAHSSTGHRSQFHSSTATLQGVERETILVSRKGAVGYITLNRPKQLNALNLQVQDEVIATLKEFDADKEVKCVIITGSGEKAFAGMSCTIPFHTLY